MKRSELRVRALPTFKGQRRWQLTRPFWYCVDVFGRETCYYIPGWYIFNGASVPRVFWSVFPPTGDLFIASCVHDWLCDFRGYVHICKDGKPTGEVARLTSKESHELFGYLLKAEGVPWYKRALAVNAVKWFGPRWREDEEIQSLPVQLPEEYPADQEDSARN